VQGVSGFATGTHLGTVSNAPWALPYFGEMRHPVGLYQSLASVILSLLLWTVGDARRPARVLWLAILGYSLIRLITDGFRAETALLSGMRVSQIVALVVALVVVLLLASGNRILPDRYTQGDSTAPEREHEAPNQE
jgi:phosphatidylglycerol---prolipoprotein diacylglyceryl transferase